jgi:hypothetical protein
MPAGKGFTAEGDKMMFLFSPDSQVQRLRIVMET